MDFRLLIIIIGLPIYLVAVVALRRYKQWLVYYLMAAFGLTLFLTLIAEHFGWDQWLVNIETFHTGLLGQLLRIPSDILTNGRLILAQSPNGSMILKLGIECSGILELGVLIGLLLFYPAFHWQEKIFKLIFGVAVTYAINIARMLLIVGFVWWLGPDWTYVGHAVVGRLFFFVLTMVLYWFILTKPTLKVVGEAAKERLLAADLGRKPGRAYVVRRRYMAGTIAFIILGFGSSFVFSSQWHKAFGPMPKVKRPIIYPAETRVYPVTEKDWEKLSQMPETPETTPAPAEEIAPQKGRVLSAGEEAQPRLTDPFDTVEMPDVSLLNHWQNLSQPSCDSGQESKISSQIAAPTASKLEEPPVPPELPHTKSPEVASPLLSSSESLEPPPPPSFPSSSVSLTKEKLPTLSTKNPRILGVTILKNANTQLSHHLSLLPLARVIIIVLVITALIAGGVGFTSAMVAVILLKQHLITPSRIKNPNQKADE